MKLEDIHSVYMIGIGGIGMSALARWFKQRDIPVSGYDRVETTLTKKLVSEGISVHYEDRIDRIDEKFQNKDNTLVIYTPAIPGDHQELRYFKSEGFNLIKRSEVLGMITKDHFTIAVAGTHGKTTTSSMIAHILNGSEKGCSAFVGGIMTNYDSNLIIGNEDSPVVVEADEFDRSFMRLHPDFTIVTSIDPDHLDIYGDKETIQQSYLDFMQLTDKDGKILLHEQVANQVTGTLSHAFTSYGLKSAQIRATNVRVDNGYFLFDYMGKTEILNIKLYLPGFHNVVNAVAAITAALDQGMSSEAIKARLENYSGVKRRFEFIIRKENLIYIDDYAHHPSEIEAFLLSVKKLFPGRAITAVFQPHLYTRTRDFSAGFSKSLSLADRVLLLDIYPARELPIKGISSDMIFENIDCEEKYRCQLKDFPEILDPFDLEVLATIGAGDIDTLVPKIKNHLNSSENIEA